MVLIAKTFCGGDERRAHVISVREGGESLDVHAEQARERVGFSVTELRKFPGGVLDRAVTLTELYAGQPGRVPLPPVRRVRTDGAGRGGETVARQRGDEGVDPGGGVGPGGGQLDGIPLLERADAGLGEATDRVVAGLGGQEAQRLGREVVVVGLERLVAALAEDVGSGRGARGRGRVDGGHLALVDEPGVGEVLEVAPDRRAR